MSSSTDSSSDDECDVYTNAASKLHALKNQKKSHNSSRVPIKDVININKTDSLDLTSDSPIPVISTVESVSTDDRPAKPSQEPIAVDDIDSCDEDLMCVDDAECVLVNESTPKRNTRNSRKRNANVIEEVKFSKGMHDSIEDELNKSYGDSFNMSQEDNDNCVMIGSPEMKKSNKDNPEVTIKVLWKSDQCQRFELGKYETFQKVFKSLANLEGITEDQVLITKKDRRITPFDTPASIEWSILDILDGGVVSADLVKRHKGNPGQEDDVSQSGCKIKIQTSDKRTLTLTLKQDEPFSTLLKQCSEQLSIPESKIKFYFDGELIEADETPDTLDIEEEACIDCKIAK